MSKLKELITEGVRAAMRGKNHVALTALRSVNAAIANAEKAPGATALTEDDITKILVKAAAQRRESIEVFATQSREDLAAKERAELAVIETLLPKTLSDEETVEAVKQHVAEGGYAGIGAMKDAMATFNAKYIGRVDPKKVGATMKQALTA
jgi:uncharacterized protein YqeY